MSLVRHLYQIVFSPKKRMPVLTDNVRREVYTILYHQFVHTHTYVHRIGGTEDHVHIIAEIPASQAVADVIKVAKKMSSALIYDQHLVPHWEGWQEGYGSITYNKARDLEKLINYVKNQQEHHRKISFVEELRQWMLDNGVGEDDGAFLRLLQ